MIGAARRGLFARKRRIVAKARNAAAPRAGAPDASRPPTGPVRPGRCDVHDRRPAQARRPPRRRRRMAAPAPAAAIAAGARLIPVTPALGPRRGDEPSDRSVLAARARFRCVTCSGRPSRNGRRTRPRPRIRRPIEVPPRCWLSRAPASETPPGLALARLGRGAMRECRHWLRRSRRGSETPCCGPTCSGPTACASCLLGLCAARQGRKRSTEFGCGCGSSHWKGEGMPDGPGTGGCRPTRDERPFRPENHRAPASQRFTPEPANRLKTGTIPPPAAA